ncbi:MAG TPA: MFS transporter [Gammaproteobacteria bacterium]|jgi:PAT family beta-lactamase induction signal transducer AmpG
MRLILADSRALRFFSFTVFYIAQGLPFGLVNIALPAYLAAQGVSNGAIGSFIGIASLPWTFKLLAGPMMDRFYYLAMGRRRPWVIVAQVCLVLTGIAFAFFPQAHENIALLTALCFLLNSFAAAQDVAVDGMAIDVLPPEEHGRANAFMAFGQVAGISGSGIIAGFALLHFGMLGVALMLMLGFGLILLWCIAVRERAGEKLLPWTEGRATERSIELRATNWIGIARDLWGALVLPASLLLAVVAFLFRFANVIWTTEAPAVVVQQLGYSMTDYSSWTSVASFIAAMAGLLVGLYIDRKGLKLLYGSALLLYGLLAVAVGLLEPAWSSPVFLLSVLFLQAFIYQGVFVSFIATSMNLCWVKVSATQFAIYMAFANLGITLGGIAMGPLSLRLAHNGIFILIGLAFFVAVALLWKANLSAHRERIAVLARSDAGRARPDFATR